MSNDLIGPDELIKVRRCSRCRATLLTRYFELNGKHEYFKTCNTCREKRINRNAIRCTKITPLSDSLLRQPPPVRLPVQRYVAELVLTEANKLFFMGQALEYIPNETAKFSTYRLAPNTLRLVFQKRCAMIILDYGDTWRSIKRVIDEEVCGEKAKECQLCCEDFKGGYFRNSKNKNYNFPNVQCKVCFNSYCLDCQVSIFKRHRGVIVCPYCRHRAGSEIGYSPGLLEKHIQALKVGVVYDTFWDVPFGYSKGVPFDTQNQCVGSDSF
jgi:hypothetical protein